MALSNQSRSERAALDLRRTALLAGGDALMFISFATIGLLSHSESVDVLAVLEVAAPFAIGWSVVAPFLGVYQPTLADNPRAMLRRTALTWLVVLPIGMAIRSLIKQNGLPPVGFVVTTFLVLLVFLLAWRGVFAWWERRR